MLEEVAPVIEGAEVEGEEGEEQIVEVEIVVEAGAETEIGVEAEAAMEVEELEIAG